MTKMAAGWIAFVAALSLSFEAAWARMQPGSTSSTEAQIIGGLLAFAAAAFGISAYEHKKPLEKKE